LFPQKWDFSNFLKLDFKPPLSEVKGIMDKGRLAAAKDYQLEVLDDYVRKGPNKKTSVQLWPELWHETFLREHGIAAEPEDFIAAGG
jgi:hypothetical protein